MNRNKKWPLVLAIGVAITFLAVLAKVLVIDRVANTDTRLTQLDLARTALAAMENIETENADRSWNALHAQLPQDPSVALNRALNRILAVDALTEATTNATLDAAAKQAARQQLPSAIEQARQSIQDFASSSDDVITTLWLNSRIDLQEASLLPASITKSLRRDVFNRLASAVGDEKFKQPRSIMLGGLITRVLDESESPANGLPMEIRELASKTMADFSDQHPDNLFLALRAAQLNIGSKSKRASDAVARTLILSRAIEPSLRVQTQAIGLTPDELVAKINLAVETGDWQSAENQMLLWFNVLNSTDLVKTDRRRASPHPLDRLSFDAIRRFSAELVSQDPIVSTASKLEFGRAPILTNQSLTLAVAMDIDLDLDPDVITLNQEGTLEVLRNGLSADWQSAGSLELKMKAAGAFAADLFMVDASDSQRLQVNRLEPTANPANENVPITGARHNTLLTLIVYGNDGVRLIVVDGRNTTTDDKRVQVVDKPTGLEEVRDVESAIAGDLDGDGDLDLIFATKNLGVRLFVNRGNRTFFEARQPVDDDELGSARDITAMAIVDLDRDLDLDVVTLDGKTGSVGLIENLLHLQFRFRKLAEIEPTKGADQILVADVDGNVSWDLIIGGGAGTNIVYSQTADAGIWTVERVEMIEDSSGKMLAADLDNDSWIEVLCQSNDQVSVKRLAGGSIWKLPNSPVDIRSGSVSIADFDLDGKQDLLIADEQGAVLHQNKTSSAGHHLAVRFRGIDDNNANSGRVNHYAIGSVLELRFGPHYRAKIITSPTTHFGIDGFDHADSLRVIFPNGLTQTIRNPAIDSLVEEEQTLKGSCPYLYAWNGEKFVFVTDCLWAAPLGLQVAAGVVAKDRPWEYLKVDGDYLSMNDGKYELRITEELWEVAYFDHIALTAVDHPADVDVWTNEKVGPADIAEPTIHAFDRANATALKGARDTQGRDVTSQLTSIDQTFVQGFDRRIRQGLCPPHWIDLDFGRSPATGRDGETVFLVLTGWILPTDTSLNIQIDQNPELPAIEFPSVWVPDSNSSGGWKNVIPFMGFPGGKTKTIVVDVTGVLNQSDPRFRIRTSAQIYWDAASLVVQDQPREFHAQDLTLIEADLRYHGFSKRSQLSSQTPDTYDYTDVLTNPKWPPLQGKFTRFGNCKPLLDSWDDKMVVMGSGDEMRLCFEGPKDELPEGWKRDFVLHCVGWDKDADLNTLSGQSSMPLPFKAMQEYPPTISQASEQNRVERDNESHLDRMQSFRKFWNR